eukprot:gene14310-15800_t
MADNGENEITDDSEDLTAKIGEVKLKENQMTEKSKQYYRKTSGSKSSDTCNSDNSIENRQQVRPKKDPVTNRCDNHGGATKENSMYHGGGNNGTFVSTKLEETGNSIEQENQKREKRTRKGFEPYQIKKGKLLGAVAPPPPTSQTSVDIEINQRRSVGPNKERKTVKESRQITKRTPREQKAIRETNSKGRGKFYEANRGREKRAFLSTEKKTFGNAEENVTKEDWDDVEQSSGAVSNSQTIATSQGSDIGKNNASFNKSGEYGCEKEAKTNARSVTHTLVATDSPMLTRDEASDGQINLEKTMTVKSEFEANKKVCENGKVVAENTECLKVEAKANRGQSDTDIPVGKSAGKNKKIYEAPIYNKRESRGKGRERNRKMKSPGKGQEETESAFDNKLKSDTAPSTYMGMINTLADEGELDWDLGIVEENGRADEDMPRPNKRVLDKSSGSRDLKSKQKESKCIDKKNEEKDELNKKEPKSTGNKSREPTLNRKDSKSKTAGIIVLPSPDVLKTDVKIESELEPEGNTRELCNANSATKGVLCSSNDRRPMSDKEPVITNNRTVNKFESHKPRNIRIASSGEDLWMEVQQGVRSLRKMLAAEFDSLEGLDRMLELSTMLQDLFKELIVKHQDMSFKCDVEGCLWKNTFHNTISKFRSYLDDEESSKAPHVAEISQCYWNVLQDGDDFLEDLLNSIQEEHKFNMHEFAANPLKMSGCKKQVKLAVRSCHLILLYLGDIERYIADLQADNNYSRANEKYQKARSLAPKNGKSYNQLAIVAVKCKHKLDALYYYVRSLEASNPIESARERLTGIFQDIKRKAEQTKNQKTAGEVASFADAVRSNEQKRKEAQDYLMDYSREDVWVFYRSGKYYKVRITPHGKIQEMGSHANEADDEKETPKVSLRECILIIETCFRLTVEQRVLDLLSVHAKQTVYEDRVRVDYDSIPRHDEMLEDAATTREGFKHEEKQLDHKVNLIKSSPLDTAIVFGMDMCAELARHCTTLLQNSTEENQKLLDHFLPAVRTWMKWMCVQMDLIKQSSVCHMKDIWQNMVLFFNATRSMKPATVLESKDGEPTALFEDLFLAGFQPLIDLDQPSMNVPKEMQVLAEQYMRSENIKDMTYMISESHKLPVVFSEASYLFEIVTPDIPIDSPAKNGNQVVLREEEQEFEDEESDVVIEDVLEESDEESRHLRELMAQKLMLTAKLKEQQKREQERTAIVESNTSQVHMISENHPTYIVPDTNCFIDNLEGLTRIVDSKDFTVILPLIVVNELDGLKKNTIAHKYPSEAYAAHVSKRASMSIGLLEQWFGEGNSQLKALTSVGTELDTIAFRDEELSRDQGKNDDIILSCCLHYCEEEVNRYSSNEGPLVVQRKVVLLTDDRNLRLKAHSRNVPTINLNSQFRMIRASQVDSIEVFECSQELSRVEPENSEKIMLLMQEF